MANNIQMIHELSGLEVELREKVHSQTGQNSIDALQQLNRVRNLIIKYAVAILKENDAKYQTALAGLGQAMTVLEDAQANIEEVSTAIKRTAQALDVVEELAKLAA